MPAWVHRFRKEGVALMACIALTGFSTRTSVAEEHEHSHLTRLFFQDHDACTVRWADVHLDGETLKLTDPQTVKGFKELDTEKQVLVQMRAQSGVGVVGVRDEEEGKIESGWNLFHTGVAGEEHGDHIDWEYTSEPEVWVSELGTEHGNPAHVYLYDGLIYVAQDRINGYSRINPREYFVNQQGNRVCGSHAFHVGGGNHITLAVADAQVGYSAWIDGGGPNKGRVDVTKVRVLGNKDIAYTFQLPEGVIHGATVNQGKVFFAPTDGIYWCQADVDLQQTPDTVELHHISLGKDEEADKPLRTGAFETYGRYVFCITGAGKMSQLCLIDAKGDKPTLTKIALDVDEGNRPLTPEIIKTRDGRRLAFVFHNHPQDVEVDDFLSIVDLDPNTDMDFSDAKEIKKLKVGNSKVQGHHGHHGLVFDADARFAFLSNPGDGTVTALSLKTLEPVAQFTVGGMPTHLIAEGGVPAH